jgi:hypothetical protein
MIPMMNPLATMGQVDSTDDDWLLGARRAKNMGLAGLSAASSFAGILSQMGATRAAGRAAKQSAYMAAQDEALNRNQAYVAGVGQVAGLRKQLAGVVGSRLAAAGGSGVDVGQGMVQDNAKAIVADNDTAAGIYRTNAEILARRHQINALALELRGNQAEDDANSAARAQMGSGILSAILSLGGGLLMPVGKKG